MLVVRFDFDAVGQLLVAFSAKASGGCASRRCWSTLRGGAWLKAESVVGDATVLFAIRLCWSMRLVIR